MTSRHLHASTFVEMFTEVCDLHTNAVVAEAIKFSEQYVSDLRNGRRTPSVELVDRICEWMGRGPRGRLEWHQAGARAHGWKI